MREEELVAQIESLTNKVREKDQYISKLEERLNNSREHEKDEYIIALEARLKNSQEHKKDEYIVVLESQLQKLRDYQNAMEGREKPIEVMGHWVFELR